MTAVIFQFRGNRAEVYTDTLCVREDEPSCFSSKAHILIAEQMIVVSRGPDDYGFHLYEELTHSHMPNGIEDAVKLVPANACATQKRLFAEMPSYAEKLKGQVYIIGRSHRAREFQAYRALPPDFEPERLPEGLHASPGPGCESWHVAGMHPFKRILEVAKLQKRAVREDHGYECIGGDLWKYTLFQNGNVEVAKVHRFADADVMAAKMSERSVEYA